MEKILKINKVEKYYGNKGNIVKAIEDISFDVKKSEFVGIMGPSGSGKTTLLNMIATIDDVSSGNIYLDGKDLTEINRKNIAKFRRENLGFIFQDFNLLDTLTIHENIALALTINKTKKSEIDNKVLDIARELGIEDLLSKYPYEVSGGQKQRLALARVILADRPMIIFDEATSNIDVESEESIWEAIYELSKEKTILVISHRLANVTDAKNIYVMNKGKLVENGTHEELMKNESCYYNMVNKQNELEMIREVC